MKNSIREMLLEAKESSMAMALVQSEDRNEALIRLAELIEKNKESLFRANQIDLAESKGKIAESLYARLKFDEAKLKSVTQGLRDLAEIPDRVGEVALERELDNALELQRITVPLGVIAIVFESRPDVIPQILGLILKSGNACVLKGGREAQNTNHAFMSLLPELHREFTFFPSTWAQLIDTREDVAELLKHDDLVDLVIPRGSNELVRSIKSSTKIPVLGHADGICHLYVHEAADIKKAIRLTIDSKTQSPSACNAIETLLVDQKIAKDFLTAFSPEASKSGIQLLGCEKTLKILKNVLPATEEDWSTEYSDLRLSVKVVDDIQAAIKHINHYGSHHTDVIVSENAFIAETFLSGVDSASVFVNCSSRFADGYRYGFGAEVGISTDKLHARGPVGIDGLFTYKYKLRGNGQILADYKGPKKK